MFDDVLQNLFSCFYANITYLDILYQYSHITRFNFSKIFSSIIFERIFSTINSLLTSKRNLVMKNTMSKILAATLFSSFAFSFAHAADENSSKAEINKQIQVCKNKKQGDWVVYANKGVTFNGTCEPNENGKLQFTFPAPPAGASAAVQAEPTAVENVPAVEPAPAATEQTQQAAPEAAPATAEQTQQANPEAAVEAPAQAQ